MPTYINNSGTIYSIKNLAEKTVSVKPGETIQTYHHYTKPDLTLTDPKPYYNPVKNRYEVVSTGVDNDQTIALNMEDDVWLGIQKVSDATISVFYDSLDNTPAACVLKPNEVFANKIDGRVSQLILQFDMAGSCEIIGAPEEISND